MNNRKYKKWAQWKPQANSVGTCLSLIKRTYVFLLIIIQYHSSFYALYSDHMSSECLLVAATRITVSLESSDEQQEIQEMGSVEAISKQRDTGYVFV
jgi:hypothetical protein